MTTIRRYAVGALCAVLLLAIAATCGYCARDRRAREEAAQAQAAARRASDEAALAASGAIVAERTSREAAQHAAEELADHIGAPVLARLPIDPEVTRLADAGHVEEIHLAAFAPVVEALAEYVAAVPEEKP